MDKVKYLVPVMLDAARPEEKIHRSTLFILFFSEIKVWNLPKSFGRGAK